MTSYARMGDRGRETSSRFKLRAVVEVRERPKPEDRVDGFGHRIPWPATFEVIGECGHLLEIVGAAKAHYWRMRMEEQRRHRKRCELCPRDS